MADFSVGATLAALAVARARPSFELVFNQMQNTIIRRLNGEIDKVNNSGTAKENRLERLQRDALKLVDSLPILQEYRFGNLNNSGQLEALYDETTTLISSLGSDDVDASEVAAFNAQRDIVVERLRNIYLFVHPNVVNGNVIEGLKDQIETLEGLTPVVGTQADNQALIDTVNSFQTQVSTGQTTTIITISTTLDLEQKIQAELATSQTEILELGTLEAERKELKIRNLQAEFANLLQVISLSFETNSVLTAAIANSLQPVRPAPGSVLNLFI